jgi:alpha-L-fucosidase
VDIVSKNGNLLLNIGSRPDGSIPDQVRAILMAIGAWLGQNGEAIYSTEPWKIYGEGPTQIQAGFGHDVDTKPYTTSDFRFTRKGDNVYVISLACPTDRTATIHSFGLAGEGSGVQIQEVRLLGSADKVDWLRTTDALNVRLPRGAACKHGFALRPSVANPGRVN